MKRYLSRLSDEEIRVLDLISVGFKPAEIIRELHISKKQYNNYCASIFSNRNKSVLL